MIRQTVCFQKGGKAGQSGTHILFIQPGIRVPGTIFNQRIKAIPGAIPYMTFFDGMNSQKVQKTAGKPQFAGQPYLDGIDFAVGGKQRCGHTGHSRSDNQQVAMYFRYVIHGQGNFSNITRRV